MDRNEIEITRLKDEIADLKAELVDLSGKLQSGAKSLERAARPAIDAIRDNPGTVSSVAITAGLLGVAVGYLLSAGSSAAHQSSARLHW